MDPRNMDDFKVADKKGQISMLAIVTSIAPITKKMLIIDKKITV